MELYNSFYYINVIMCVTSCFGQSLHADVLTNFFTGNSRRKVEHSSSKSVKINNKNQNIPSPVVNEYLDILLHKSRREKVLDLQNPHQKANIHLQSRKRKLQQESNVVSDRQGKNEKLRPLSLYNDLRGGRIKLFEKPQNSHKQATSKQWNMYIKPQIPLEHKLNTEKLTREEEILRTILKLRGINIDFKGNVNHLATSTSRPNRQVPFSKLSNPKDFESVKYIKQPSTHLLTSTKVSKVSKEKISRSPKQTTPMILNNISSTKSSKFPSQAQRNKSKFTATQHTTSSLLQSITSTALKQHQTSTISMTSSMPQSLLTYNQPTSSPNPTSEITTVKQTSQELTSTPHLLALPISQQQISNNLLVKPVPDLVDVIQPQKTLPITSSPSFTIQKLKGKKTYQNPRGILPLPSMSKSIQNASPPIISTTKAVPATTGSMTSSDVSIYISSTPSSTLEHFQNVSHSTVTTPTTFRPGKIPSTQRSFNTKDIQDTINNQNNSSIQSVYQTLDDKSNNTKNKILVTSNANLFFEKLKGPNFLTDLKNGKDKGNKRKSVCAKECTIHQNVCKNGATCLKLCSGFTCICAEGFTGYFCDKIVKTTQSPKIANTTSTSNL